MKKTPRRCSDAKCGARLRDTLVDWEDELPPKEMNPAAKHCRMADVVLCLGTSLQITPACNLPLKCLRGGGEIVIVNLQPTPKDKKARLVIHGLVDKVIAEVMSHLHRKIPSYIRIDYFEVILNHLPRASVNKYRKCTLKVTSTQGEIAPIPFIQSAEISFPDRPMLKPAFLHKQPFVLKRETLQMTPIKLLLKLNFSDGCGCQCICIEVPINFQVISENINHDKDIVTQKLRDVANQNKCCGQLSAIEKTILPQRRQSTVYGVVTNFLNYTGVYANSTSSSELIAKSLKRENEDPNGTNSDVKKFRG